MRLRATVVTPDRPGTELDVLVEAAPGARARDLVAALAGRVVPDRGAGDVGPLCLFVGGLPVDVDAPLGWPPLLDGVVLTLARSPTATAPPAPPRPTAPLHLATVSGPDSGRRVPLPPGRHRVGRDDDADVTVLDEALSRTHLVLDVGPDGVVVGDAGSTNGTRVDGHPVGPAGETLGPGSVVAAGSTRFELRTGQTPPAATRPAGDGTVAVNRSPRCASPDPPVVVRLPEPPVPTRPVRIPWPAVLLPLPVAVVLALVLGPHLLLFALMGPVVLLGTVLADRVGARRTEREDRARHAADLAAARAELAAALEEEHRRRRREAPDAAALLATAATPGDRLWERRPDGPGDLLVRVGTGTAPSLTTLHQPGGARTHPVLREVPVTVPLAEVGVLGIAGSAPTRAGAARFVLGQLATTHSPAHLALWVLAPDAPGPGSQWAWVDLLPHAGRAAGRTLAHRLAALAAALERSPGPAEADSLRHVVLLAGALAAETGTTDPATQTAVRTLLARGSSRGVHVVCLAPDPARLPPECGAVLTLAPGGQAALEAPGAAGSGDLVADLVGEWWAGRLARALAPLRDPSGSGDGGGLPGLVRWLDLTGVDPDDAEAARRRWEEGSGPTAVLGVTVDGPYVVDLVRDGPHVLVGGTTGSGKSELLQTLVLALATACPPTEISFVLVDYKGGSALASCARLPHTVGVVTDLDGHLGERVLASLRAELARREELLRAAGAIDLADLRARRGREAPGRLVVVVDEFRVLAEELPEVLSGLVRLAATGRSLGVHLVLATQRPAGVVSADLRANVNLRIALRVRDRADSEDVVEAPDAAALRDGLPGRGFARTGAAALRAFQVARVSGHGPRADEEGGRRSRVHVRVAGGPPAGSGRPAGADAPDLPSDLDRLAATLGRAASAAETPPPHVPWLPPLPEVVRLADLDPGTGPTAGAPWGLLDEPARQRRSVLTWSPDPARHVAVVGGPGSGRTSAAAALVASVARTWTTQQVHVHVVDGGGGLADLARLPTTGAVVPVDDASRLLRLVARLESEVARRRHEPAITAQPALLLVVDGWERLRDLDDRAGRGRVEDRVLALARDAAGAGLRLVATGGRALLTGRVAALLGDRLVLPLADPGDVVLAGLRLRDLPAQAPPGRAVRATDGLEVQLALPGPLPPAPGDRAPGPGPFRVEPIPDEVDHAALVARAAGAGGRATAPGLLLGAGGDDAGPIRLDLARDGRRVLVCGPPGSGRTTTLATLAVGALGSGTTVAVVTRDRDGPLSRVPGLSAVLGPRDAQPLADLRAAHPRLLLLVDDADRLVDAPVAAALGSVLDDLDGTAARGPGGDGPGVVVAATTDVLAGQFRGPAVEVARHRTGVLLCPRSALDGEVLGTRVEVATHHPGHGVLVRSGRVTEVQVARWEEPSVRRPSSGPAVSRSTRTPLPR